MTKKRIWVLYGLFCAPIIADDGPVPQKIDVSAQHGNQKKPQTNTQQAQSALTSENTTEVNLMSEVYAAHNPLDLQSQDPKKEKLTVLEPIKTAPFGPSKYFSVGVRLGAYGMPKYHALQLEALYTLNTAFRVRFVVGGFYHYFKNLYFNNTEYQQVKLNFKNAGFIGDWHLFKGGLRVSGGFFINRNTLDLTKTNPSLPGPFPAGALAATSISTHFKYRWFAPYIGMGYDTPILWKTGLSLSVDAGFLFQGKAKGRVTNIGGPVAGFIAPQTDTIRKASEDMINSHRWLRTLPIMTIGLRYNFS